MFIASLRTSGAVAAVFFFLMLTFLFLSIGDFVVKTGATSLDGVTKFGGWLGIITRAARLVRLVRGGHQLHVQAGGRADVPARIGAP